MHEHTTHLHVVGTPAVGHEPAGQRVRFARGLAYAVSAPWPCSAEDVARWRAEVGEWVGCVGHSGGVEGDSQSYERRTGPGQSSQVVPQHEA